MMWQFKFDVRIILLVIFRLRVKIWTNMKIKALTAMISNGESHLRVKLSHRWNFFYSLQMSFFHNFELHLKNGNQGQIINNTHYHLIEFNFWLNFYIWNWKVKKMSESRHRIAFCEITLVQLPERWSRKALKWRFRWTKTLQEKRGKNVVFRKGEKSFGDSNKQRP